MKMVYFSSDRLEVEWLKQDLTSEGIACEILDAVSVGETSLPLREPELWVQNDGDAYRALALCVERETGLGKKSAKTPTAADLLDELLAA